MTDAVKVLDAAERITDADGAVIVGATIKFYNAGTSNARTVYADTGLSTSLGSTVYCDGGGYPVTANGGTTKTSVYTGTTAYRIDILDGDGVVIVTLDNQPGALDTSGFTGGTTGLDPSVVPKTSSFNILAANDGVLFDCDATGGVIVASLPTASGNSGVLVGVRQNSATNTVTINTTGGQTIRFINSTPQTSQVLSAYGQEVWLISDGTNWVATCSIGTYPTLGATSDMLTGTSTTLAPSVAAVAANVPKLLTFGTVSSAAALAIVLTPYSGYVDIELRLKNFVPATDATYLQMRLSTDGGSIYDLGANSYFGNTQNRLSSSTTIAAEALETYTAIPLSQAATNLVGNGASEGCSFNIELLDRTNAAIKPRLNWRGTFYQSTDHFVDVTGGALRNAAQDTDAVQFFFASGNIASGTWSLWGRAS